MAEDGVAALLEDWVGDEMSGTTSSRKAGWDVVLSTEVWRDCFVKAIRAQNRRLDSACHLSMAHVQKLLKLPPDCCGYFSCYVQPDSSAPVFCQP